MTDAIGAELAALGEQENLEQLLMTAESFTTFEREAMTAIDAVGANVRSLIDIGSTQEVSRIVADMRAGCTVFVEGVTAAASAIRKYGCPALADFYMESAGRVAAVELDLASLIGDVTEVN